MNIYLFRHGKTRGNMEKRYIGVTDEPLCREGIAELKSLKASLALPCIQRLYVSPLLRCRETASIFYPGQPQILEANLRECDFGDFENKNYRELSDNPDYQKWVDSMGTLPFPHGEDRKNFSRRCVQAFEGILEECGSLGISQIAMVVHGGTIMSIMEAKAVPAGGYYDFQIPNGRGYRLVQENSGFPYTKIGF